MRSSDPYKADTHRILSLSYTKMKQRDTVIKQEIQSQNTPSNTRVHVPLQSIHTWSELPDVEYVVIKYIR